MTQSVLLKAAGLYTFPNKLSQVPNGAMAKAKNVVINRDAVIESRRGFKLYGTAADSVITDTIHQLLIYKGRLLRHYGPGNGSVLEFDSDGSGTFSGFNVVLTGNITLNSTTVNGITSTSQLSSGMIVTGTGIPANTTISSITNNTTIVLSANATATNAGVSLTFSVNVAEVDTGLRIKGIEQNSNFYFTTSDGIKKISSDTAANLSTAVITNAGGVKALDVQLSLNPATGFFTQESIVAYRVVWGIKDANTNLILGTPSGRALISNPLPNLLITDLANLLTKLDGLALSTGIHAATYVTTYKAAVGSTASTIRTNLISLAAGLDTDIPAFTSSGAPTVTGSGPYTVVWTTTTNPTNIIAVGDPVSISGVTPTAFNTTGTTYNTVTAVTASTITYTQTANPGAYSSGTATIRRQKYSAITQPVALSASPTSDQLLSMQAYYDAIVSQLQIEPSGIITTPSAFNASGSTKSSTTNLQFTIPQGITTAYFYQVYRTSLTTSGTGTSLSLFDPGDEQNLVYEANPTNTDLTNGYIKVQDITPDSFRNQNANLYTNQNSGEGTLQANDVPPLAKDIASFKGYTFYANTQTKQRKQINMLSVSKLVSGASTFTITDGTTTNTYTFVNGVAAVNSVICTGLTAVGGAGKYFNLNSANNNTSYYVWYNVNSGNTDPAVAGKTGIQVTINSTDVASAVATKTKTVLNTYTDFTVTASSATVTITNSSVGIATNASDNNTGFTITTSTPGAGEDAVNKKILISSLSTPSQQVDETAKSLIRVVNKNLSELVYAFYLSGPSDIPGLILFESRKLGANQFYFTVDSTNTGSQFDSSLPTSGNSVISSNEVAPNRMYYSKFQQPDAVPIVNYVDVGTKDRKILRVLALRDNLFILKEEAIYRLTGLVAPFQVSLFDGSTILKAPDSAVVLNNLIYCYTTQGVARISDTGVEVVSRPIEDQLIKLATSNYPNFSTSTFGVSYESDRSYYLYTVTNTTDTYATQLFRYNTFTNSWTQGDLAKRSGVVCPTDDKLYLGPTDTNYVEQERKNFDRTDYADRELSVTLGSAAVTGAVIIVPSVTNISVGDVFFQTQYLTIDQFNRLLSKLDKDSILTNKNYASTLTANPGDLLSTKLDSLITAISTDAGRVAVPGSTAAGTYTALSPTNSGFVQTQTNFNNLINLLNADIGVGSKNYKTSTGTLDQEITITAVNTTLNTLTLQYAYPIIQGVATVYNHINCELIYVPQYMQDPSMGKQISESTMIFEDTNFSSATISFSSDLSPNFEDTVIPGFGSGSFGNYIEGTGPFGGNGSSIPFRTLIPREKQRCRFLNCRFLHTIARESFAINGLSLTYNMISQRAYR